MGKKKVGDTACIPACQYNKGVGCFKADKCEKCGWNPAVEKRRKERMAKAYALQRRSS